jgi:hypothetical protein
MASNRRQRSLVHAMRSLVIASTLALGLLAGGLGLRQAAASTGCDFINTIGTPAPFTGYFIPAASYVAGDELSIAASDPSAGGPTTVELLNGITGDVLDTTSFPGTVSYIIPTGGVYAFGVKVDGGTMATFTFSCVAAAPLTATSTNTPTEPPLATPIAFVPTSTAAAGPIAELPGTGGGPGSSADSRDLWLLVSLLALIGLGVGGVGLRRLR